MEQLSRIAQGLLIGNGEVWNFLDYAVNRDFSSLISYTQNRNFLATNLFNNFDGGVIRRYYNGIDIKPTENYSLLKNGDSRLTLGSNANSVDIGELYSVDTSKNSNLKFVTTYEFTEFQDEIRKLTLLKKKPEYGTHVVTTNYLDDETIVGYESREIGDEYKVKLHTQEKPLKTLGEIRALVLKNKIRGNIGYKNEFILNNESFPELYIYGYNDGKIKELGRPTVSLDDILGEGIDTDKLKTSLIREKLNVGLYEYYRGFREKYLEREKKNPSTSWRHSNSYGVDFKNLGEERYSLNDKRRDVNSLISPEFKSGNSVKHNPKKGTSSYTYFQEPDGQTIPGGVNTNGGVYGWNSVSLSDYSGTSRLLQKTNELFRSNKIKSLINRFHTDVTDIDSDVISSYDNNFGISRGRNLIKKKYEGKQIGNKETGYDNPYCRVWTAHRQYSKLKDRIRPFVDEDGNPISIADTQSNYGNLRPLNGNTRLSENTVLKSDGYVRFGPSYDESGKYLDYQKYMFSIENLAWRDVGTNVLSTEQKGPKGGRIMWFPPYNLKFSENVNVNWNANSFIGRGEEIYTYTNTTRSGTLDFTLLIDHPSILNKFRGTGAEVNNKEEIERDILRYFAGCGNLNDDVEPTKEKKEQNKQNSPSDNINPQGVKKKYKIGYVVFFPNNFSGIDVGDYEMQSILYEYNKGASINIMDEKYETQKLQDGNYDSIGFVPSTHTEDIKKIIFNSSVDDVKFIEDIIDLPNNFTGDKIYGFETKTCKISNVSFKGFASNHGRENLNNELCLRRRTIMEKLIGMNCEDLKEKNDLTYTREEGSVLRITQTNSVNELVAKLSRAAYAIVEVEWKDENVAQSDILVDGAQSVEGANLSAGKKPAAEKEVNEVTQNVIVTNDEDYTYDNEYLYFSNLRSDSLEYKSIVDKVRYFDPGFHSMTPEGFNSRLTFLHQCTRQGPTNAVSSGHVNKDSNDYLKFAGNLAFGRAPYCILRIGDFFYTKICIDSLSISYDNNGIQWDLNPDGAGVQPMYANISISFKFIGGQDISGPIERLQNAVTANYYANASVYSRHADNETTYYDAIRNTNTIKE